LSAAIRAAGETEESSFNDRISTSPGRLPWSPGPVGGSAATSHGRWRPAAPTSSQGVRDPGATDVAWTAPDGGFVGPLRLDVTDVAGTREAVDAAVATYGRIDILVNNAGLGANHDALDVSEADWDEMMAVNLKGVFFASQAVGRHMVERGYGRIVNISSQAGLVGIRRHAVYSASKGGVNLLTKVLALEWAPHGVTVNAIAPTWIYTPGTAERLDDPAFLAQVLARIPVGRVGTSADVAAAVVFLSSRASGLVTGAILPVDGGWTAQ
jgi:NAD(P)-dependent dehydrogenase (short-subunit alcohol dehydrogenase family)